MCNLEISNDNVFLSNNDESDINTKVVSLFVLNGYYLKNDIIKKNNSCKSVISLEFVFNINLSDLRIESNRCSMLEEEFDS